MKVLNNIRLDGRHKRPLLLDVFFEPDFKKKPIIIFCHGFKGFKDWGAFNEIGKYFALRGYIFIKFNFSHNGTTVDAPTDFADLEAFGNNNFSIEMDDLTQVIDWVQDSLVISQNEKNTNNIYLIGHSRGGSIAILKAAEDPRISKLVTWAAVSDFALAWHPEMRREWKENGVRFVENKRTNQQMPLYYQLAENYDNYKSRLDIPNLAPKIKTPWLAFHGTDDDLPLEHALNLKKWQPTLKLEIIPGGDHTFGVRHPHTEPTLPTDMELVLKYTDKFLREKVVVK